MSHTDTHKRPSMLANIFPARRQAGASLIVSLMLLVVLTLLGVSGMQSTIMQERMSSNVRDKGLAFQAAESAVRGGEDWVQNQNVNTLTAQSGCTGGPCNLAVLNDYTGIAGQDFSWWQTNGRVYNDIPNGVVASAPRFIVEEHSVQRDSLADPTDTSSPPVRTLYRLTAIGVGGTLTAESMVETLYARID
jgi:type IV pilus assembly protein PilX